AFSENGTSIFTFNKTVKNFSQIITLTQWDLNSTSEIKGLGNRTEDADFVLASNGKILATIDDDKGLINCFDANSGKQISKIDTQGSVYTYAFSPDGNFFAGIKNGLKIWNLKTGELKQSFNLEGNKIVFNQDSS